MTTLPLVLVLVLVLGSRLLNHACRLTIGRAVRPLASG